MHLSIAHEAHTIEHYQHFARQEYTELFFSTVLPQFSCTPLETPAKLHLRHLWS